VKATLQKIYEKHPHLAPKKVDGLEIEGLRRIKVVEKKDEKDEFEKSEDWVLQRLFKKAGAVVDSAIDQRAIKEGGTDYKRIDEEAQRVAKLAVAALHKLSKPKKELEGKVKSGSKSKSVLEKIRERRSVNDEIEAPLSNTDIFKKSKLNPNYKLARQLRDFLQESKRGKLTDDLVTKFDGNVNHSAVFKAVLKQIAVLDRKTHRWKLRDQFKQ